MELTDFQTNCEKRLTVALRQIGKNIVNRRIEGNTERFIVGNIQGHEVTFWIYSDAADFETPAENPLFERPDYDSLNDLADEFIKALVKAIEK